MVGDELGFRQTQSEALKNRQVEMSNQELYILVWSLGKTQICESSLLKWKLKVMGIHKITH